MASNSSALAWTVVMPVNAPTHAKSRLSVPGLERRSLARAIAADTVEAVLGCARVSRLLIVTPAGDEASALRLSPRVELVHDAGQGLRRAIASGLETAGEMSDRAVLLGDLPALQPHELEHALSCGGLVDRGFVADADRTGTSLATARAHVPFPILFGAGSAAAHRRARFSEIPVPRGAGLRRDVDTAAHLASIGEERLGVRTRAALALQRHRSPVESG